MQPIIELNNIQFNYQPEDASPALKDVSFSIQQGEWVAIICLDRSIFHKNNFLFS